MTIVDTTLHQCNNLNLNNVIIYLVERSIVDWSKQERNETCCSGCLHGGSGHLWQWAEKITRSNLGPYEGHWQLIQLDPRNHLSCASQSSTSVLNTKLGKTVVMFLERPLTTDCQKKQAERERESMNSTEEQVAYFK